MRTRHASLFNQVLTFDEAAPATSLSPTTSTDHVGWASNAWLTSDGVVVLNPGPAMGSGLRRRRISGLSEDELDPTVPRLHSVLAANGISRIFVLAKSEGLLDAIVAAAAANTSSTRTPSTSTTPSPELWIAGTDIELLARQRTRTSARLVDWTTKRAAADGLERRMATLHGYGIDALAMPHKDWSAGSIALCHRFGIMSYGWGCEHEREMAALIDNGIDAVQTRFPDRLRAVIDQYR